MNLSKRIAEILKEKGISTSTFVKNVQGVDRSQVYGILKGKFKTPRMDTIEAIADALGINPGLFWSGYETQPVFNFRPVAVVGRAHAGTPHLTEAHLESMLLVPLDGIPKGNVFSLRVVGSSMQDVGILDGDFVFYLVQRDAPDGSICVVTVNDETFIRMVYRKDRSVILQSANRGPDYSPYVVTERDRFQVDGVVIGKLTMFKGDA